MIIISAIILARHCTGRMKRMSVVCAEQSEAETECASRSERVEKDQNCVQRKKNSQNDQGTKVVFPDLEILFLGGGFYDIIF